MKYEIFQFLGVLMILGVISLVLYPMAPDVSLFLLGLFVGVLLIEVKHTIKKKEKIIVTESHLEKEIEQPTQTMKSKEIKPSPVKVSSVRIIGRID